MTFFGRCSNPAFSPGLTAHVGSGVHVGSVGCGERSEPHRSGKMTGRERCGSLWSPHPTRRGISGRSLGTRENTTGTEAGRYRLQSNGRLESRAERGTAPHKDSSSHLAQISFLLSRAIDRLSGSAYSRVLPMGMPKAMRDTFTWASWS
jgi:hypothetical protein